VSDIPAFRDVGNSSSLPTFFNSLYYYCIGIAVVIAVLQLARAGITYMLSDTITSKEEARHLIAASFLGLVLVLSPYIVFKLINPAILSLNINTSGLQLDNVAGTQTGGQQTGGQQTGGDQGGDTGQAGAPTSLQSTSQTSNSATLSWTAPTGGQPPTGYQVFDGGKEVAVTSSTGATVSNLASGTHQFTVKSVDSEGKLSAPSNQISITITGDKNGDGDGAQGAYVASEWEFIPDNGFNAPPVNCWSLGTAGWPVPYEGKTKEQILPVCEAHFTGGQGIQDYSCVFITPGQKFTPAGAPGKACKQYTCTAFTPPGSGWVPCK
jgi:hypothetical protein